MKIKKELWSNTMYHIFIILMGFLMLYPVLWVIMSSFKIHSNALSPSLIPKVFTLNNYIQGWKGFGDFSFSTFFKNSFIVAIVASLGQTILSACTAYGFARIKFIGRNTWFGIMILTLLLPKQVLMLPQYLLFNKLGLINSLWPLILPQFFPLPFFVFLMIQFIKGIPMELDEAAQIDGCNTYSIFFRIILPNIKPALITVFIFSFYWTWQDFLSPLLYIQSAKLYTVPLALQMFSDPMTMTSWGAIFAMSTFS